MTADRPTGRLTARQAQRRYLGLSAVRWFASGLVFPVQVLLYTDRGLDLTTIGALITLFAAVVVLLELPSGALADLFGRRRTALLAGAFHLSGMLVLAFAQQPWQFAVAVGLTATGRALGSGPLESWYVDTVRAADPSAPLRGGIARGWTVEALGIGVAAVLGGAAPGWFAGLPDDGLLSPFSVPALGAAAVGAASLVGHALLMTEATPRVRPGRLGAALGGVPGQLRDGVRLAWRDPVLRLLTARTALIGLAVFTLEILAPLQFAELLGGPARAAAAYGLLTTTAWLLSAAGSAVAPGLCRVRGSHPLNVGALFTGLCGGGFLLLVLAAAGLDGFLLAAVGFLVVYFAAGVPGPLTTEVVHDRVDERRRATLVSVTSLALQLGGLGGAFAVAALAQRAGYAYGWSVAAAALTGATVLTVLARRRTAISAGSAPLATTV